MAPGPEQERRGPPSDSSRSTRPTRSWWTRRSGRCTTASDGWRRRAGARGFDGVGFSPGFGDIFDAFFGGFDIRRETGPRRGGDLHHALTVTLEEAASGAEREVDVLRQELCTACDGTRCAPGTYPEQCKNCRGTGQVRRAHSGFFGQFVQVVTCSVCRGEGRSIPFPCSACEGAGRVKERRTLTVRLPPGVDDGMQLRMRGQGDAGLMGGPAGDVYISLTVESHPVFNRDGDHLVLEMPVNVAEAALGGSAEVPLLGDAVQEVKVPAGVQSGTLLRVKGRGLPNPGNGRRGDLLVYVRVVTPPTSRHQDEETLPGAGRRPGRREDVRLRKRPVLDGPVQERSGRPAGLGLRAVGAAPFHAA